MEAFKVSVAHLLNVVMRNNLSNKVLCCTLCGAWTTLHMYSRLCLGRSVLSHLSLAARLSNTLFFFKRTLAIP